MHPYTASPIGIRLFPEETDNGIQWTIDGFNGDSYTDSAWSADTLEQAIAMTPDFIARYDILGHNNLRL